MDANKIPKYSVTRNCYTESDFVTGNFVYRSIDQVETNVDCSAGAGGAERI